MAQDQTNPNAAEEAVEAVEAELAAETQTKKPGIVRRVLSVLKKLALILLFVCLIGGGFFFGVHLRIIDMDELNRELGLYKYPVIGEYFSEPEPLEETGEDANSEPQPETAPAAQEKPQPAPPKAIAASQSVIVTQAELEKQLKVRQAEEKKRVSKLARLYEQMKPSRAAEILQELNDDVVIAILQRMDETQVTKILSEFETARSARVTQRIYNGPPPVQQVP